MAHRRKSRKHPLFFLLLLIGLLVLAVFYFAASRIAKQVKAGIEINWICYFTLGLAVASTIHIALSIALFTSLPPKQIPCCSLFTITTLLLGTAWTLSTVAQIFEDNGKSSISPPSKPDNGDPPLLKIRAILSGVLALLTFISALLSSLNSFSGEIPEEKDNRGPIPQSLVDTQSRTQSFAPQRHNNEALYHLPTYPTGHGSYPGPAELDSYPIETYQPRRGNREYERQETSPQTHNYPWG